ncbi:MAG TPA: hypothetical protein VF593_04260 [Chthoniobacteraceae bacterium]|jgi:hypothetical protein
MKAHLLAVLATFASFAPASADDSKPDLKSPKPEFARMLRILLHTAGSSRMIDYPDVAKVVCVDPGQITFETSDGYVVTHQGTWTVIQQRSSATEAHGSSGTRFFDAK